MDSTTDIKMTEVYEFLDKIQERLGRNTEQVFHRLPYEVKVKLNGYWSLRRGQERCLAESRFNDFVHFTPEQNTELVELYSLYKERSARLQKAVTTKNQPSKKNRKVHGKKYREPQAAVVQSKGETKSSKKRQKTGA